MTSKEWKKYKLGEIADINMGQSPKSEYYNTLGDGIAFLQGNRTFGFKNPAFDTYTTLATKIAQAGDVIMSVRAPVGDLNITPINICIGRGLCSIRMKNNNQEFLYYLMKYCVSNLINRESGTVFGSVNRNDISSLEINVPCDDIIQRKIAKVLSVIDDKIELNNSINNNLEQQAQAIFKSWFVDFEPFNGTMPDDWKLGKLDEISNITSGKRPAQKSKEKNKEMFIPIIGASSIMGYTNDVLYNEKILVTGRVGTHGIVQKISFPCWTSDNTLVVKSDFYEYIYQILKTIDYASLNRGSTQPLITQTDLKNIEIIIPDNKVLTKFEHLISSLTKIQNQINQENEQLTQLRDTLLPKLMSGEIDVSKVEIDDILENQFADK